MRISGPFEHNHLSVFFLQDESRGGPVPLTLKEGLLDKSLRINETGNIHELSIENTGKADVFVQAGDIVKGGRQDRVLGVSMVVPAQSGRVPVAAYCVEAGRWGRRGFEDQGRFTSSLHAFFSPRAKMALRRAAMSFVPEAQGFSAKTYAGMQQDVWGEVAATQSDLARSLRADVRAPASPTSLDLSMEQPEVKANRGAYVDLLARNGRDDPTDRKSTRLNSSHRT